MINKQLRKCRAKFKYEYATRANNANAWCQTAKSGIRYDDIVQIKMLLTVARIFVLSRKSHLDMSEVVRSCTVLESVVHDDWKGPQSQQLLRQINVNYVE